MPPVGGRPRIRVKKREPVTPPRPEVSVRTPKRQGSSGRVGVFSEPLTQRPFAREKRQAARHVARAILEVHGKAPQRALKDEEVRRVLRAPQSRAILESARRITAQHPKHPHRGLFDKALEYAAGGPSRLALGPSGVALQRATGISPGRILTTGGKAAIQTIRAGGEAPGPTLGRTVKGLAELGIGAIAAVPEVAVRTAVGTAHGDPLAGVKEIVRAAAKDVSRRYGPLYRDEPGAAKAFRERVKKEGAASELVDVASVFGLGGATVGRSLGRTARRGALGPAAQRFASAPRPRLRISGEASRPQELSRNLIRVGGQRAEDALRRRATAKRVGEAEKNRPIRGLQPRPGEVVARTRVGQRRLQRIEQSSLAARSHEAFRNELTVEVHKGARREFGKLSKQQRRAVYPVLQGYVELSSPRAAVASLRARNRQILAERAVEDIRREKQGLAPREYGKGLHDDEVRLNNDLIEHAQKVFGDGRLRHFQALEARRSIRVAREQENAHPAFKSSTAEARRLRAQGHALGIEHPYDALTNSIADQLREGKARIAELPKSEHERALRDLERWHEEAVQHAYEQKPELDREFSTSVREAATERGLPEPAFIGHHPRGEYPFSDFAQGGARAVVGPRVSKLRLHSLGIADTRPARYIQSLARTIKYTHNWPVVTLQAETHSFQPLEFGSHEEIANIVGRPNVHLDSLDIEDWKRILHAKGLDAREYAFWNPGRLARARADLEHEGHPLEHLDPGVDVEEGSAAVHEGWQQAAVDDKRLREAGPDSVYLRSRGWKLIPREVYKEITAGTHPSGLAGRLASKAQGFQSRFILGSNPAWLQFQIAANANLVGFGHAAIGTVPHPIAARRWFEGLPADAKRAAEEALSLGVLQEHGAAVHLGASTDARIVGWVRAFGESAAGQQLKRKNPVNLLFKGDDLQNKFFRKTLLYSSVKRQAMRDIRSGVAGAYGEQRKIAGVLRVTDPRKRMAAILRDPQVFERHADYVNRILGDYSRYTARERRFLKRYVLFYGFFRYALRTAFYTLPVKHPLAASLTAKLAQLHNDEVKELLGGPQAPWAYSRIFFGDKGDLRSIDLGRASPVQSPAINLLAEGRPQALGGVLSPLAQEVLDQLYGKHLFSGQGFRVHGSAEDNPNPGLGTRFRIAANDLLTANFIAREVGKATAGPATQGDDTLPFSPRPLRYKQAATQERERKRQAQRGSPFQQFTRDLFPLVTPRPDTTRDAVARAQRRAGQRVTVGQPKAKWGYQSSGSAPTTRKSAKPAWGYLNEG